MSAIEQTIETFNKMDDAVAQQEMLRCCGSVSWCKAMIARRPFVDRAEVHEAADCAFATLTNADWLEAFLHHPRIGDVQSLRMKFAGNREWSAGEQAGVAYIDEAAMIALAAANQAYRRKFGFIFIVCATGKSASEMLAILRSRLPLDHDIEIKNAAIEQTKITHLRIDKWEIKA